MKILEACYEFDISKINILDRKTKISNNKTLIHGAPKVGKTYIIYDYLSEFISKEYLYIDLGDVRNNIESIAKHIDEFIKNNDIKILVLENFNLEFGLPICENIIISSNKIDKIDGFSKLQVMPLDFEEFLAHDNKHQNITQSFNYFLKYGNFSEIIYFEEHKKIKRMQEILKLMCDDMTDEKILTLFLTSIDEKKSIYQLFTNLKKNHKISKDRFYEYCEELEKKLIIFFVSKYNQPKVSKKIYSYNHAFLNMISHEKKFKNEFTNMIFLELFKNYEEIYYLDYVDFYIPSENKIILSIPFYNELIFNSIKRKISNILVQYNVKKIEIISISVNLTFLLGDVEVLVLPFYEWAIFN